MVRDGNRQSMSWEQTDGNVSRPCHSSICHRGKTCLGQMGLRMLDTACHQYLALRVIALRVIALRVIWGKTVLEMIGGRYRCGRSFAVPTTTTLKRNGMSCAHVSEVESHTCFILLPEELGEVEPRMFFFWGFVPPCFEKSFHFFSFFECAGEGGYYGNRSTVLLVFHGWENSF